MKLLHLLIVATIALIALGTYTTEAIFSDSANSGAISIGTSIWNPGKPTITSVIYDPIGNDAGKERIEIRNTGGYPIEMAGHILHFSGVGSNHFVFPSYLLSVGAKVTIHVNQSGTDRKGHLFWDSTGDTNLDNSADSISLFKALPKNATTIIDFIQYGKGGQNQENNAVIAGIWTAGDFIPDADEGYIIEMINNEDHNKSSDWSQSPLTP